MSSLLHDGKCETTIAIGGRRAMIGREHRRDDIIRLQISEKTGYSRIDNGCVPGELSE